MSINIAINGLGRIGRAIIRAVVENNLKDIKIVAVNGTSPAENYSTLIKYDSIHGILDADVTVDGNYLVVGNQRIKFFSERDPSLIPWGKTNAEIIFECTGNFTNKNDASKHLRDSVDKVIISAPSQDADATIVYGVNNDKLKPEHKVISIGSCTTNALAPILKLLNDNTGIESGYMTTIHAYTNDQKILDNRHKDIRRARACHLSMIPTSTGAAKAISFVIPELEGKLSGSAIRVPVPNVSMIDLSFIAKTDTTKEQINNIILEASRSSMNGIISVAPHKLVSIDFNHNSHSSIFDPFETEVVNNNLVRIVAWYDNEWGFSNRMLDIARITSKTKKLECIQTLEQ